MSIEVTIKQKLFGKQTMPLEVILGEELHYGKFENDQLHDGELGEEDFIAYHPNHIGRGFSVIWNPGEKKQISLRLPQPSTPAELADFFAAIERMVTYWKGSLIVDGNRQTLPVFLSTLDDMIEFNTKIIKDFSQKVLDGEHKTLTLYSAMWPLSIGKEEAEHFLENPFYFSSWLHEKQSMDVYFESPDFFGGEEGIIARYFFTDHLPAIFPSQPVVPFGYTDPSTGKPLECDHWYVFMVLKDSNEPLGEIEYNKFLSLLPKSKITRYDAEHFLLDELTEEEMKAIAGK
jgi:hypothetical protein